MQAKDEFRWDLQHTISKQNDEFRTEMFTFKSFAWKCKVMKLKLTSTEDALVTIHQN